MASKKEQWPTPAPEIPAHRPHKPRRVVETRPGGPLHSPAESEEEIRRRRENPDWIHEQP